MNRPGKGTDGPKEPLAGARASAMDFRVEPLDPEYFTPPEAAALLRVSEKTLGRWAVKDPTLPVLKIGGTVRYPAERFRRWLRQHEQGRQPSRTLLPSARNGASVKASS
jgi:excisionase family DNA binding protein